MILKSMGVECKKDDMDGYAGEVDEEATGKFTFLQFCQVVVMRVSIIVMVVDKDNMMSHWLTSGPDGGWWFLSLGQDASGT